MNGDPNRLRLPERFTARSLARFSRQVASLKDKQKIFLDFGPSRDISPGAALYIHNKIAQIQAEIGAHNVEFINTENHPYLGHLGLFQSLGINIGRNPNLPPSTDNYLPLQKISTQAWLEDLSFLGLSEHVDTKCRHLSNILCKGIEIEEKELIHYNIRELIRNIFEHSQATELCILAQYWPQLRKAEIALSDNGVGITQTISRNNLIDINSDQEAISAALMPGVTGSERLKNGDEWDNSGYGLYMTSEIARRFGHFYITSGNTAHEIRPSESYFVDSVYAGTLISMGFEIKNNVNSHAFLSDIAISGEKLAKENFGRKAKTASRSSKGS